MDFDDVFEEYYSLYRAESDTPASTDEEYTVALRYANEAIRRWANYDGVYWKELFTTLQDAGDGTSTITSGTATYTAPEDMREAGGFVKVLDASNNTIQTYPILEPQEAQFKNDDATYAYFTGDPNNGYTLHLNPTPDSSLDGKSIDYVYYKKPTFFASGSDYTEVPNPTFLVHRALAMRFRVSRNWTGYQTAMRDAEEALKLMKLDNDSGNWANPWKLADNSGSQWGW